MTANLDLLGYETYLAHPALREQIDREVGYLRAQAVQQFIVAPVAACIAQLAAMGHSQPKTTFN
jgi:hypothetical protein